MRRWPVFACLLGWVWAGLTLAGCSTPLTRYQFEKPEMGTKMRLTFYAKDETTAKAAAEDAFDRVECLNDILSDYVERSELNHLSASAGSGSAVTVSDDLWDVLERAQQISTQTAGAFDITVGPVVKLWRQARKTGQLPDPAEIQQAVAAVGYEKLQLDPDNHTALLTTRGMQLDLGGIGKGYAADAALKILREHGITRALVAAAGDIAVADPPPGREAWRIAVDPFGALDGSPASLASAKPGDEVPRIPAGSPSAPPPLPPGEGRGEGSPPRTSVRYLLLHNAAVSTSGDVHQHIDINGKRYSHIVDPKTGIGLTNAIAVTVIAPNATTSDALAKVGVVGVDRALKIINATPGIAALIAINDNGEIKLYQSDSAINLQFDETARP